MNGINKRIHFVGSEGVSMKMLKTICEKNGFWVSGSDITTGGHNAANVDGAGLIVYSAAIKEDNPELIRAGELGIAIVSRAEFLGRIAGEYLFSVAVSGSHGKTTTTAMLWEVLSPLNPTVHIGGNYNGQIGKVGGSQLFITEACEYKRSFLSLTPDIAVVLNVDLDHTDCYADLADLQKAFAMFAKKAKSLVVYNGDEDDFFDLQPFDNDIVQDQVGETPQTPQKKQLKSIGFKHSNHYYAACVSPDKKGRYSFCVYECGRRLGRVSLSVAGRHNVYNALAVIAVSRDLGLSFGRISAGLSRFCGAERRMEFLGFREGSAVFSDYAHHPKEIIMSLQSARESCYRHITTVFEPHTYTRTQSFFADFVTSLALADRVIILPIYAAREQPVAGVDSRLIAEELKRQGVDALYFDSYAGAENYLKANLKDDGVLLFMGAGTIDSLARSFIKNAESQGQLPQGLLR